MEWIARIAMFYLLSVLIQQLLPSGKYRKYIRLYMGLLLIWLVLAPVTEWLQSSDHWEKVWEQVWDAMEKQELHLEAEAGSEWRWRQILEEYRKRVEETAARITEEEGYDLRECVVEFNEDTENEEFGRIQSLCLTLSRDGEKEDTESEQSTVDPVVIDPIYVGETIKEGEEETHPVLNKIRDELAREYALDPKQVHIFLQ